MCRVNADAFPGSLNSNTDIVIAMIVADGHAVKLTQSELSDSQSVNRTTLFSLSQMNYRITRITDKIMTVKCVTTIPCIDPADLSINISD